MDLPLFPPSREQGGVTYREQRRPRVSGTRPAQGEGLARAELERGGGGNGRSRESELVLSPPPASAVAAGDCGSLRVPLAERGISPFPSPFP